MVDLLVEIANDLGWRRDPRLLAAVDQFSEVRALQGPTAGEDFVEDEAKCVDVAARRDLLAGQLLGRHVGGRAGAQCLAGDPRQPEVGDAHPPVAVQHDVGRLEVAMHDPALVRRAETGADLPRHFQRAIFRKAADAFQEGGEVFAVYVFHREERMPVDFVDVVDAADVRMRDLARHSNFAVQLRESRRIAVHVGGQELERDRLSELQIVGAEDLAHPAAAKTSDDAVAAAEDRPRREAAVIDGPGTREPATRRSTRGAWRLGRCRGCEARDVVAGHLGSGRGHEPAQQPAARA